MCVLGARCGRLSCLGVTHFTTLRRWTLLLHDMCFRFTASPTLERLSTAHYGCWIYRRARLPVRPYLLWPPSRHMKRKLTTPGPQTPAGSLPTTRSIRRYPLRTWRARCRGRASLPGPVFATSARCSAPARAYYHGGCTGMVDSSLAWIVAPRRPCGYAGLARSAEVGRFILSQAKRLSVPRSCRTLQQAGQSI